MKFTDLSGYENGRDYWLDLFSYIDCLLYYYYNCHKWLGPDSKLRDMLGIVISREEFEHNLSESAPISIRSKLSEEEKDTLKLLEDAMALRLERTAIKLPLNILSERFMLDDFERYCVTLAYAGEFDEKYAKIFGYLQDDINRKRPGIDLAVRLLMPENGHSEEYAAVFRCKNAFTLLFERDKLSEGTLQLRAQVAEFLSGIELNYPRGFSVFDSKHDVIPELVIGLETASRLDSIVATYENITVILSGPDGSGKRLQIKHLMARSNEKCLFADFSKINDENPLDTASLLSRITGSYLALHSFERERSVGENGETEQYFALEITELAEVQAFRNNTFLLTKKTAHFNELKNTVSVEIPPLSPEARLTLFGYYMDGIIVEDDVSFEELSETFRFEPRQIRDAANNARMLVKLGEIINIKTMHEICYAQVTHKLEKLATRLSPRYDWNDIVLPKSRLELLKHACSHISQRHRVFSDWGFGKKLSYGTGLSILFTGAPGTGKTMCAQIIAGQLNMEIFRINISQIVSKYIGETEKNLAAVFQEAKRSSCILFFDECDAIFGKRSEVKDSHDRNANIEVAYLLQEIEEHDGVTLLASNLAQNIDSAFMRRITYAVSFPFPDKAARKEIYRKMIPMQAPVNSDVDFDYLADKFSLSGGHIKNIVLSAAFMAANENSDVCMRHMLIAAIRELRKNDIVVVRENYREYTDLVFGEFEEVK